MKTQNALRRYRMGVMALALFLAFTAMESRAQAPALLFEKDSYELTAHARSGLDAVISSIKKGNGAEEIALIGHTDGDAADDYNKTLSFNRAQAVRQYMQSRGIQNKIHIESKGETQLLNKEADETEKGMNRRVEIIRNYSRNNFAFDAFQKAPEVFTVNTQRDTLIICRGGTQVKIDAKSFVTSDNTTPITIKIQEYTSKSDFILSNLTTLTANNEQLESGGMMNIEAWQGDKKLELKENKPMSVLFKDRTEDDQMQLFNGAIQGHDIIWNLASGTGSMEWQYGTITSSIADAHVLIEKWKYERIYGVRYKITERTARGKTTYDTISVETANIANDLFMTVRKMGWINCDRFYKSTAPKVDIVIEYKGNFAPNVVAVFPKINSILPYSYRENNKLIFKDIPANLEVTFVGLFKLQENNTILYAQTKLKGEESTSGTINFRELKQEEIEEIVKTL